MIALRVPEEFEGTMSPFSAVISYWLKGNCMRVFQSTG